MPETSPENSHTVTTREIAARAGVSTATVSLALRDHPRISARTRERVKRAAEELHYCPDPQIAKLMHRLRSHRKPGFHSTLAALTTFPEEEDPDDFKDVCHSAKARAESLGYAFTLLRLPDQESQKPAVQRILTVRGVEGILLLPLLSPRDVTRWLDWSRFSVVTATYGVLAPEFHRVVAHQFANTLVLCRKIVQLGYRRIGLAIPERHDLGAHHGFSAAVAWHNLVGSAELVRPLVYPGSFPVNLRRWFERERPDVIIAAHEADCRRFANTLKLGIPGPVGFAVTERNGSGEFAGISERPLRIGAAAIDLLHAKIMNGSVGIPEVATVAMIPGECLLAPSVRRRPRPDAATSREPALS